MFRNRNFYKEFCNSDIDFFFPDFISLYLRGDVREIGSAIASVILGEVRSDHSVMAEDVEVPTLQHLLRDANDIDEVLLDQTMASLLSTYNQVTRRLDKLVWQVIKVTVASLCSD